MGVYVRLHVCYEAVEPGGRTVPPSGVCRCAGTSPLAVPLREPAAPAPVSGAGAVAQHRCCVRSCAED